MEKLVIDNVRAQCCLDLAPLRSGGFPTVESDIQSKLLSFLAVTPHFTALVDAKTDRVIYLNPAARAMLSLAADEDLEQVQLNDCFGHANASDSFENCIAMAKIESRWTGECYVTRRNGREVPVEVQLLAHRGDDRRLEWLSVVARDLTKTIQARHAQEMEAIGRLAAGIAHEINTPTQYVGDNVRFLKDAFGKIEHVLKNHAELVRAARGGTLDPGLIERAEEVLSGADVGYLGEQIPNAIGETLEGVERIATIVRAMKEFSQPGGKEKVATNLNAAIESTVTVARNEWSSVADLELDLDPSLPAVPCMVNEFNQSILTLLVNAAQAIGDVIKDKPGTKGRITIRTRRDGKHVQIELRDTGAGIPKSVQSRIFEPFFTTKTIVKASQGLSIVYGSIVNKHGGSIEVESEVGKGTAFILRLPLVASQATETRK